MFNGHRSNAVRSPKTSHSTPGLMSRHPLAGKPAPKDLLIDVGQLEAAFYEAKPDPGDPNQLVSFGTSGHRGTSLNATFTESHILAITQAICEYRATQGITGPMCQRNTSFTATRPAERVPPSTPGKCVNVFTHEHRPCNSMGKDTHA